MISRGVVVEQVECLHMRVICFAVAEFNKPMPTRLEGYVRILYPVSLSIHGISPATINPAPPAIDKAQPLGKTKHAEL